MHPELHHAINTGLSIPEITKVFAKHYSGPMEEYIEGNISELIDLVHGDSSFWDKWKPLCLRMRYPIGWIKPVGAQDPFLSIHKGPTLEIISWLCDSKRRSNIYLIVEGYGSSHLLVETPTRARIIASICYDADRLGVQPFDSFIYGIISQLAARYPPYRRILTRRLIDNPRTLELSTRARFKQLIHEPWKALLNSHPQYSATPPVIVLHWDADSFDEELFRSICEFSFSPSLLWIISTNGNVKFAISDFLDPFEQFGYIRLPICYDEAASDAALVLYHKFSYVRAGVQIHYDDEWPSNGQMSHLVRIVSGVIESIDVIIDFVDRPDGGGPKAHLETFLAYMVNSPSPSDERPYCAMDHFYIQAFSRIPPSLLAVANKVLGVIHHEVWHATLTPLQIACLLSIENATILSVYPYLSGWAFTGLEEWYSRSVFFKGFLKDPKRSGRRGYAVKSSRNALESFLDFLSYSSNLLEFLKSREQAIRIHPDTYDELEDLRCTISYTVINPLSILRSTFLEHTLALGFDFRCLAYACDTMHGTAFAYLLLDLHEFYKVSSPNIVRIEPVGLIDMRLIKACQGLVEPWDVGHAEEFPQSPCYVLLGFEDETVLVVLDGAGKSYKECIEMRVDIYA